MECYGELAKQDARRPEVGEPAKQEPTGTIRFRLGTMHRGRQEPIDDDDDDDDVIIGIQESRTQSKGAGPGQGQKKLKRGWGLKKVKGARAQQKYPVARV